MRIKCDLCKKMFVMDRTIKKGNVDKYYHNKKIVGYSVMKDTNILKTACVSGKPVKTKKKTLRFYCKNCYKKINLKTTIKGEVK